MQTPGRTAHQAGDITLGPAQQRQHGIGQLQQAQAAAGEAYRFGLAHKQGHAHALFKLFELVGQRGLGQMQALGCFHQAV